MMMMSLDNSSIKTDSISSCESSSASDSEDFTGEVFFESQLSTIGNRLIGCAVMVRNKLNETYHGTLVTFTSDFDVILESCHQVTTSAASTTSSGSNKKTTPLHSRIFERDQIVQVVACDIEDDFSLKCDTSSTSSFNDSPVRQSNDIVGGMSKLTLSTSSSSSSSSGCSSSGGLLSTSSTSEDCGRELEPYVFDDGKEDDLFYSLTTDTTTTDKKVTESSQQQQQQQQQTKSSNGWKVEDMLQVNKSRYGYKSTFNSEMTEYTLPLIKQNTAEFRRREAEAERLAREIESDLGYRANVDKELSDGEDDEEMAFSAVHRTDKKTKTPNTERHRTPKTGSTQQQQRQRITSSATSSSSNRQRNPRRVK